MNNNSKVVVGKTDEKKEKGNGKKDEERKEDGKDGNEGKGMQEVNNDEVGVGNSNILSHPTSVFVAIPAYDFKICVLCAETLMNAMQVMMINNIKFEFKFEVGNPYVSAARNQLVGKFMATDFEQFVFIDADIGISPHDFLSLILAPEDVVSGAYPKKSEEENYAVQFEVGEDRRPIEVNGALKATGGATGVMKIRRHVFEKMMKAYGDTHKYKDFGDNSDRYNFFGTFIDKGKWYGDDFGFCKLWRDIGGEIVILPDMTLIHVGNKNYEGNVYEFMVRQSSSPVVHALCVEGWMSQQELEWLHGVARDMNSVVEIGSFKGRATTALLEACKGKVYAVDHWLGDDDGNKVLRGIYDNEDVYGTFMKNVGCYSNLEVMKMSSVEAAHSLNSIVDMVFIDGEHTYESVKADIGAWLPRTRRLIAGHDYNKEWPGVINAVKEMVGPVNTVGSIWWKVVGVKNE